MLIFNQKRERDRSIQKEKEQPNKFLYLTTTPLQTETLRILSSFEIQIHFVSYVDMENPIPLVFLRQIISRNTFKDTMILRSVNSQNQSPRKGYLSSLGHDGSLMKKFFATFQKSLLQCLTQTNKFVEITHSSPTFRTLSSVQDGALCENR